MILSALTAIASAWLLGVLAVSALWPRTQSWRADLPLILPLGIGVGFGLTSAFFFAASLISTEPMRVSAAIEALVDAGLAWWLWRRPRLPAAGTSAATATSSWLVAVVASILVQACIVAVVATARAYAAEPLGSWDGWAIWNMHARFIFRGGENWSDLLRQSQIGWTHADYPLLVPASVARVWAWVGRDAPFASGLVSAMFGIATVGLLVAAIARLRHRLIALTGGLVLLGTPFFVTFSSNEHADIPLGFFVLATVALIALSHREPGAAGLPMLAGFAAGMAAWTKNEGLLFAVVVGLAWGVHELVRGSRRMTGAFLGGLAVALLPVLYFKGVLAPPNDVVSGHLGERLGRVLDGSRHRLILTSFWRDVTRFGEWRVVPFLAMVLPLIGPGWRRLNGREWLVAIVVGLMVAGYYGIYLLTPWDLAWHLEYSLVRLLLQLWPAAIFFWCLAVTESESPAMPAPAPKGAGFRRPVALAGFLLVNAGVAGVLLTLLSHQLAPNELARAHVGRGDVSAVIGDGWFGRETDSKNMWVWSKGESALLLRVNAKQPTTAVTLRFSVRGLGARTVTAKIGGRVVWRGNVGEQLAPVEIADLALPAGVTALVFTTDTPGVPESTGPDARPLTFAVYAVRMK